MTAIRHPISRRNNYLEIHIKATNRICVNRRQAPRIREAKQNRKATKAEKPRQPKTSPGG